MKNSNNFKQFLPYPTPDYGMEGICGFSVKRSLGCDHSIGLLKIEPGHFPEGQLRCRSPELGQGQGHEQVQVGDSGMKTMGHQPHCVCAAV